MFFFGWYFRRSFGCYFGGFFSGLGLRDSPLTASWERGYGVSDRFFTPLFLLLPLDVRVYAKFNFEHLLKY